MKRARLAWGCGPSPWWRGPIAWLRATATGCRTPRLGNVRGMADDCLFCKIIAGEIPSTKVYEDDHAFAFEDLNPQAPTHVLVVPREHFTDIADLGRDAAASAGLVAGIRGA